MNNYPVLKVNEWYLDVLSGACGIGIGLGMVRFDFGILGRLMVHEGWISSEGIGDLAGVNMAGYLLGCFHQSKLKSELSVVNTLRIALILLLIALWLESFQSGVIVQGLYRLVCGWGAAHLVTGLPSLALAKVPDCFKRNSTSIVMAGGGIGALIGALVIGNFAPNQAPSAWAVLSLTATFFSLPVFNLLHKSHSIRKTKEQNEIGSKESFDVINSRRDHNTFLILSVIGGFALMQIGQVPIVLYEPIVSVNRLGLSAAMSSNSQSLFGFGLTVGALSTTLFPSYFQTRALLPAVSLLGLIGGYMFWDSSSLITLFSSTFVIGLWDMMTGTLTYDRLGQFSSGHRHRHLWAITTMIGGIGFVIFSAATSPLTENHLNIILLLGFIVILIQFIFELLQTGIFYTSSAK